MLLGFTTNFITDFPAKIVQFPAFLAFSDEVECFNTDLYGENTTFILYSNIQNSRHKLYEFLTHNKSTMIYL